MSTLSKFQRLRASSKTTKKNNIIICLQITLSKYRNLTQPPGEKILVEDSRAARPKVCRNRAPKGKLPTQKSVEIPAIHA